MKKIISFVLCVLLLFGSLAGCGKKQDDGSEMVTLRWNTGWSTQEDTDKVIKEVNKKLGKFLPNTKLEVFSLDAAQFALKMAAKEPIDIAWTGYSHDVSTEIANGYFLELNDLVEEYGPDIKKEQEQFANSYASATINDELYALPIQQPIVHQTSYFRVPAKFNQYFDSEAFLKECHGNYKTTEKVWQIIDQYFQTLKNKKILDNTGFYTRDMFYEMATRGYDFVEQFQSGAWLCYDAHADKPEIVNFNTTEEAKLFFKYAAKWYKEGIIPVDILTATDAATGEVPNIAKVGSAESWYKLDEERGVRYVYGDDGKVEFYSYMLNDLDNLYSGTTILGSEMTYTAIPFTSEHPERAMKFLNLLRSDTKESNELLNLILYGFEKNSEYAKTYNTWHYELKGDVAYGNGYVEQATASNLHGIPHWKVTNCFLPYRTPNILDGQKEWALDYLTNVVPNKLYKTKLYQFFPNLNETYSYQISEISQISNEYMQLLYCGVKTDKWESVYKEFTNKLNAAEIDKVLDLANKKAKEFMK